ncbi:MAG: sensor of ECF-type sigma factor [Flavobacteriaceae bacterium]
MKQILLLSFLLLFLSVNIGAQNRPPQFKNREKIRALKTAYITNALDLTSKEAEKFWPIYNAYDKKVATFRFEKMHELRSKIKTREDFNALKDKEAKNLLDGFLKIERDILDAKSKLNTQLLKVISAKKILKLYKAEDDFNRRLLDRLRNRHQQNKRPKKRF